MQSQPVIIEPSYSQPSTRWWLFTHVAAECKWRRSSWK